MTGMSECFSIGSTVSCVTCFKQVIEGDVLAFDPSTKMLVLKSKGNKSLNDVYVVNLGLCSDVQVKNEAHSAPETPPSLNINRLNTRVRNSVEQKKRWVSAINAGVSPEGQRIFMAISKTLDDVAWKGSNIVVFNDVIIRPPYNVENISGVESKRFSYVKKMVERLTQDAQPQTSQTQTTPSSQPQSQPPQQQQHQQQPQQQQQQPQSQPPPPQRKPPNSHPGRASHGPMNAPPKSSIANSNIKAN